MLSALLMFRRVAHALRYAVREQDFLMVFGAGMTLVFIGGRRRREARYPKWRHGLISWGRPE